jgi:RNA polymerase sigma factor (sigma-70 family)
VRNFSDIELFALIQQDNEKAFAALMDRYDKILFRHINKRIKSINDSQEILQNIFLSFWNNRLRIKIEETAYPYLFKSARYEVIDWSVKMIKQIAREALLLDREVDFELPVEQIIIAKELNDFLQNEVANMPQTMRTVFRLSREDRMPVKEIALYLCLSEQTVKNNITLALQRLRLSLKQEHYTIIAGILLASLH